MSPEIIIDGARYHIRGDIEVKNNHVILPENYFEKLSRIYGIKSNHLPEDVLDECNKFKATSVSVKSTLDGKLKVDGKWISNGVTIPLDGKVCFKAAKPQPVGL
jgi:hypothetical protein